MDGQGKYFFIADVHLGLSREEDVALEKRLIDFIDYLPEDTKGLYLLGDIFDFWVEYKDVVPKGYVRLLGKLAELCDSGVDVYFFRGNHDYWTFGYLENEIGMKVVEQPFFTTIAGKKFCISHGDDIGKISFSYTIIKTIFRNRICMFLLKTIHPRLIFSFARAWSRKSRRGHRKSYVFREKDDRLFRFSENLVSKEKIDYFIFGHIHTIVEADLHTGGKMFILGDWINNSSYLVFDGKDIEMKTLF